MKSVSESLAGRAGVYELLPMSYTEIPAYASGKDMDTFLYDGLFPAISAGKKYCRVLLSVICKDIHKLQESEIHVTVTDSTQDGVGIAGPQVGLKRRVVAVQRFDKAGEPFEVYPNIRVEYLLV